MGRFCVLFRAGEGFYTGPLIMAKKKTPAPAAPVADIARAILVLHRQRVILDADLAALYGVTTKRLNEQVKRNAARFPEDFMFRLSAQETEALNRSHFATGSQKHRDPRFPPFAFTEHGAIMAATVQPLPSYQCFTKSVLPQAKPIGSIRDTAFALTYAYVLGPPSRPIGSLWA
jgi:hypothetical protein